MTMNIQFRKNEIHDSKKPNQQNPQIFAVQHLEKKGKKLK